MKTTTPTGGRRFGYLLAILINGAIYYVINNVPIWSYIPFLTDGYKDVLWIANISIGFTTFMYATFMVFDPRWYRSLMRAVANVFTLYSVHIFRLVFPLDLTGTTARWMNIGLLILMGIMTLSSIAEVAAAVGHYRKANNN